MNITQYPVGMLQTNSYIVENNGKGIIIDAGVDPVRMKMDDVNIEAIILTHMHYDHLSSIDKLRELTGAGVYIHQSDSQGLIDPSLNLSALFGREFTTKPADVLLSDGDKLHFGGMDIEIMHCPGHTQGGISIKIADNLFTGDTLFAGSFGRTDLPGGNKTLLRKTIDRLLTGNCGNTTIYPGHGEKTTVARELKENPYKFALMGEN